MDILQDTMKSQSAVTLSGDSVCYGFMTGIVVEGDSQGQQQAYSTDKYPGKVKVRFLTREKDKNVVLWIPVVMPAAGEDHGFFFIPEVNDVVLIGFQEGNFSKPFVMGCLYKASSKVQKNTAHENNNLKKIVTRGGNEIIFDDSADEKKKEEKQSITIKTKKDLIIRIKNEDETITITDKDKKNIIVVDSKNGNISVTAEKVIKLKAGNNTSVFMDGQNNSIKMESQSIKIEAKNDIAIEGATVKINSKSSTSVGSNQTTKVSGQTIKLG